MQDNLKKYICLPIFNDRGIPQWMVARNITAEIHSKCPIVHTNGIQHFWCYRLKIIPFYTTQLSSVPIYLPNPYILFAHENKSKLLNMEFKGP